jgi:small GTP-binding protein
VDATPEVKEKARGPVDAPPADGAAGEKRRVLTDKQADLLTQERRLLGALGAAIAPLEPDPADQDALRQAGLDLDELFLLVIVGEFNAGKSAVINALLGKRFLDEGVTPTTSLVTLLRHGDTAASQETREGLLERTYPAEFLREITIVDTPGTNAIIRTHEQLTRRFVPRSDLVLFVTSADRPFTESERAFLETIREWGKQVIIILNKIDRLDTPQDLDRIIAFISEHAKALLGFEPRIFPISARLALQGKQLFVESGPRAAQVLQASRFPHLETYIFATLDEAGRIRLKLLTPLGVAERVVRRYRQAVAERVTLLAEDARTMQHIEEQMAVYQKDMREQFAHRLHEIENIIYELRERGEAFLDDTIRITRIFDLFNADRIRGEFEREVVSDSAERIDQAVDNLIDWMVDHELRLWQDVQEYLQQRQATRGREEQMVGRIGRQFEYNRAALLQSVGAQAHKVVESYDRERESEQLAADMQSAVVATAGVAGVAAIGAIIALMTQIALVDVTGVTAAVVGGSIALFLLPAKKRQAKAAFNEKIGALRDQLNRAMTNQFEVEMRRSIERVQEAIAPYTRFVQAENTKVRQAETELARLDESFAALRRRIEG